MSIIKKIVELLDSNGLKRADLARYIGKSTGQISMWEKRDTNPPSELLPKIAEFFGVSVDYLLGNETPTVENSFTYALYNELAHDLSDAQLQELKKYADYLRNS